MNEGMASAQNAAHPRARLRRRGSAAPTTTLPPRTQPRLTLRLRTSAVLQRSRQFGLDAALFGERTPRAYAGVGSSRNKSSGRRVLETSLIIVAVFVGVGILSVCGIMFGIYRASKAATSAPTAVSSSTTPGGTFSAGDTAVLGLRPRRRTSIGVRPRTRVRSASSTPKGIDGNGGFETDDPLDKVLSNQQRQARLRRLSSSRATKATIPQPWPTTQTKRARRSLSATKHKRRKDPEIAIMHSVGS